jgi:hypothetical protein
MLIWRGQPDRLQIFCTGLRLSLRQYSHQLATPLKLSPAGPTQPSSLGPLQTKEEATGIMILRPRGVSLGTLIGICRPAPTEIDVRLLGQDDSWTRALAEDDNSEERAILCESGARPGVYGLLV